MMLVNTWGRIQKWGSKSMVPLVTRAKIIFLWGLRIRFDDNLLKYFPFFNFMTFFWGGGENLEAGEKKNLILEMTSDSNPERHF